MTLVFLRRALGVLFLVVALAPASLAQFETRWVAVGDFQNWYSSSGNECEECFVRTQQYGWRWPGIYNFTDMQAAKGLWIGAQNVTGPQGNTFPVRVVHNGPRVTGTGEFFPVEFELVTKNELTVVTVDGDQSFASAEVVADRVDPSIPSDVLLYSRVNTLLGVTMERRVYQFSQDYQDDYHIIEYVFTNTGNTDGDAEIELPDQTLSGLMFFFQWRLAVARETRYVVANSTGWGKNTMIDTRGDGVEVDPADEQFRAQYAWHGRSPESQLSYDNIGASIQTPALNIAQGDTLGRLGASQFIGVVTLHADASAENEADDFSQPSTTTWLSSDAPLLSNNDAFNSTQMAAEYATMTGGHRSPRHAMAVEPTGLPGFLNPTGDPSLGTSGGFSMANGYGPYTLAPGQSVRIVVAEAAGGLSREANKAIGRAFMESGNDSDALLPYTVGGETLEMTKNEWVFTGRDSLFQTFERAIANYESGLSAPAGPLAPSTFDVRSGGDRITLEWSAHDGAPTFDRWEVYRTQSSYDSTYTLIHTAAPGETTFEDTTPIRGLDYYYYVVAVQTPAQNPGGAGTPANVPLRSSRYATQTYVPAQLQRPQGEELADVRVVPNPFYLGSSQDVRFPAPTQDRLAFFNIPGQCRIDIYTELGELVDTILHTDGSGDDFWDHTTSSRQVVASGLYIAVITVTEDIVDNASGEVLFQAGDRTHRKFVIIR